MPTARSAICLTALVFSAFLFNSPASAQAPAGPLDMIGKMLMISNDDGTSEQRFQADGSYLLRPVGKLAALHPRDVRKGKWRMLAGSLLCTRQTEPTPAEEGCLNLSGRRVGESWSFLAVRGGMTRIIILDADGEKSTSAGAGA